MFYALMGYLHTAISRRVREIQRLAGRRVRARSSTSA